MELFEHQKISLRFHLDHPCSLDLSEVGVGKSAPLALALEHYIAEFGPALGVSPNSVLGNWEREWSVWTKLKVVVLRGDKKKRLELLASKADVYMINFEGLRTIIAELMAKKFQVIFADEIHHSKSPKSQQSKHLLALGTQAKVRKGLTGTLLTNDLADVWAPCRFVSPSILPGNVWAFRQIYMKDENAGKPWMKFPAWVPKPGAADQVRKKIEPYAVRWAKKDVLKFLPPVMFQRRSVDLSPEQARVYKELKKEFIADLDNGSVLIAADILPRISKLAQVCDGFLYVPDQVPYRFKDNAKLKELLDVLESLGDNRAIIWCAFKENVAMIRDALKGTNYGIIDGDTKAEFRQPIIDQFNRGEIQWLICAVQCISEGITLLSSYNIYYSRSFKLSERLQSLGRSDRPGAEIFESLTVIDLVCENTIDAEVLKALDGKEELLKSINPRRAREMI